MPDLTKTVSGIPGAVPLAGGAYRVNISFLDKIRQSYRKYFYFPIVGSLRKRLMLVFLMLTLITAIVIGGFSFQISSSIIFDMAEESSRELINRMSQDLDSLFSDTIFFMYHVHSIPELRHGIREDFTTLEQRYLKDFEVSPSLHFISDYKKDIFGFYVLGENQSKFKSNYYTFLEDDLRDSEWYKMIFLSNKLVSFGPYSQSLCVKIEKNLQMEFFGLGVPYVDDLTGSPKGVILAEIEKQTIMDIVDSTLGKSGFILILDNHNNILLAPEDYKNQIDLNQFPVSEQEDFRDLIINQRFLGPDTPPDAEIILTDTDILIYREIGITNWKVLGVIPRRELRADKNNAIWLIALVVMLTAFLAAWLSVRLSYRIVSPITRLTDLMHDVEDGKLSVRMPDMGGDEIGELSRGFNMMIEKLKNSLDQIYHNQSAMRKTELQLLQAQINPHFLYNTLEAIKYLTKMQRNDDAVMMIVALAKFFRSSLSKGHAIIPLEEELERIKNYLTILKLRYKNKFIYEIEVPSRLLNKKVLKLILQPLVENAVYHGIKEIPEEGLIRISALITGRVLVIEVEDSGKGMSSEKIEWLNSNIRSSSFTNDTSYGLHNVQERIRIFFGDEYGLSFRQRPNGGTIARITLPLDAEGLF